MHEIKYGIKNKNGWLNFNYLPLSPFMEDEYNLIKTSHERVGIDSNSFTVEKYCSSPLTKATGRYIMDHLNNLIDEGFGLEFEGMGIFPLPE